MIHGKEAHAQRKKTDRQSINQSNTNMRNNTDLLKKIKKKRRKEIKKITGITSRGLLMYHPPIRPYICLLFCFIYLLFPSILYRGLAFLFVFQMFLLLS